MGRRRGRRLGRRGAGGGSGGGRLCQIRGGVPRTRAGPVRPLRPGGSGRHRLRPRRIRVALRALRSRAMGRAARAPLHARASRHPGRARRGGARRLPSRATQPARRDVRPAADPRAVRPLAMDCRAISSLRLLHGERWRRRAGPHQRGARARSQTEAGLRDGGRTGRTASRRRRGREFARLRILAFQDARAAALPDGGNRPQGRRRRADLRALQRRRAD